MAKILPFRRKQEAKKQNEDLIDMLEVDDDISAIMNDYSLTPANRRWILENMLMNIDDQLEQYKRELEKAERKLDALVRAAEREIVKAYSEFETHVAGITQEVRKLTRGSARQTGRDKKDRAPGNGSQKA
jgi:hypothetical protein